MSKLRVAVLGPFNSPVKKDSIGGSEIWTYELCQYFSTNDSVEITAIVPEGSEVGCKSVVLDSKSNIEKEGEEVGSKVLYLLSSVNSAAEVYKRREEFDLVHVSSFEFYLSLPFFAMMDMPCVVTIHGMNILPPEMVEIFNGFKDPSYVFISEAQKKLYPAPERSSLIRHGVDTGKFDFHPESKGYLFWIGRISPEKGAYEAIRLAKKSGDRLVLAGPLHNLDYFNEYIKPNLDEKIQYIGEVGMEDKKKLFGGAKALLFTSIKDEPFGLVVLEANACGTPVLAFSTGAMPEIIEEGVNGFISPPKEVDMIYNNLKKINEIDRLRCRKYTEDNYSLNRMGNEYLNLYNELLGR